MLKKEEYELLKSSFSESQRLFRKLSVVADRAKDIDFDESGLYGEEEEVCERHWLKLSSKIVDDLSQTLDGFNIELCKNDSLEMKELSFNLLRDGIISKINVDYKEEDSLSITQIS